MTGPQAIPTVTGVNASGASVGERPGRLRRPGSSPRFETPIRLPKPGDIPALDLPVDPSAPITEFHITPLQPCPYIPGKIERKVWSELNRETTDRFSSLSRGGFRRSHGITYRPACPRCNACIPVRIDVRRFRWTRSLRRIDRANMDLAGCALPAAATTEQFDVFRRYLESRHGDGEMAGMTYLEYRWMVEDSPVRTELVEFRSLNGRLKAGCLIDRLDDGISAVYSFFDPEWSERSLGTYAILWLVREAMALGLPYVYLGYYIRESRKMAYKARFHPLEGLTGGAWRPLPPT